MKDNVILDFLEQHPEFLIQHAERFGLIPANNDHRIISLAERQAEIIKVKQSQLEQQLHTLTENGRNNDRVISALHQFTLSLQRSCSLTEIILTLNDKLSHYFSLDHVALRLWHPVIDSDHRVLYTQHPQILFTANNLSEPYCGPYANEEILSWFPAVPVLQSFAQIPLRDQAGATFGLLVLATDDAERFTMDMYKHYLTQLGEQLEAAISRVLGC